MLHPHVVGGATPKAVLYHTAPCVRMQEHVASGNSGPLQTQAGIPSSFAWLHKPSLKHMKHLGNSGPSLEGKAPPNMGWNSQWSSAHV